MILYSMQPRPRHCRPVSQLRARLRCVHKVTGRPLAASGGATPAAARTSRSMWRQKAVAPPGPSKLRYCTTSLGSLGSG